MMIDSDFLEIDRNEFCEWLKENYDIKIVPESENYEKFLFKFKEIFVDDINYLKKLKRDDFFSNH